MICSITGCGGRTAAKEVENSSILAYVETKSFCRPKGCTRSLSSLIYAKNSIRLAIRIPIAASVNRNFIPLTSCIVYLLPFFLLYLVFSYCHLLAIGCTFNGEYFGVFVDIWSGY